MIDYKEVEGVRYAKLYIGGEVVDIEDPNRKDGARIPVYSEGQKLFKYLNYNIEHSYLRNAYL